jgi:hypothetical protein
VRSRMHASRANRLENTCESFPPLCVSLVVMATSRMVLLRRAAMEAQEEESDEVGEAASQCSDSEGSADGSARQPLVKRRRFMLAGGDAHFELYRDLPKGPQTVEQFANQIDFLV